MLKRSLTWRIAWQHMRKQLRVTLLSILGGCIGAALITASIVFFHSFTYSGERWVAAHYGPIDWELTPVGEAVDFTADQMQQIHELLKPGSNIKVLPTVQTEVTLIRSDEQGQALQAAPRIKLIGMDLNEAAEFDAAHSTFWQEYSPMHQDDLWITKRLASRLGVDTNDALLVHPPSGESITLRITRIVPEFGITGYIGGGLSVFEGTAIVSLETARRLAGVAPDHYTAILSGSTTKLMPNQLIFPRPSELYKSDARKQEALQTLNHTKQQYGIQFLLASVIAVAAGALLMLQIMLMLADSRKELYGILRAIGLSKRNIRSLFLAEASLLNVISTGIGLVAGLGMGYGLVAYFRNRFGPVLERTEGLGIPIVPHASVETLIGSSTIIITILTLLAIYVAWKLGRLSIVNTVRGHEQVSADRTGSVSTVRSFMKQWFRSGALYTFSIIVLLLHGFSLVSEQWMRWISESSMTANMWITLATMFLWLLSVPALLLILFPLALAIQKLCAPLIPKLGLSNISILLAIRYPRVKLRRSYSVSLMFAIVFSAMTMLLIITGQNSLEKEQSSASKAILGYSAMIKYSSDTEKDELIQAIKEPEVAQHIQDSIILQPFMLNIESEAFVEGRMGHNMLPVDASWIRTNNVPLVTRDARFLSDQEAWEAVRDDRGLIILDEKFSYTANDWPETFGKSGLPNRKLHVGDTLELAILSKPAAPGEKGFGDPLQIVTTMKVTIAGFAKQGGGIQFYNLFYVNPGVFEENQVHGFRWSNLPEKGYVMLQLDEEMLAAIETVEEALILKGFNQISIPSKISASQYVLTRQTSLIYIAFMLLAVLIGIVGLAILQLRTIQERAKQVAMLRIVGLSSTQIVQMYMNEALLIAGAGIFTGWGIGSSGAYLVERLMRTSSGPIEVVYSFQYPFVSLLLLTVGILAATLLIVYWPARQTTKPIPGEAIRAADE